MEDLTEYDDEIKDAELREEEEEDYNETPPLDIVAFNELRSCSDLVRMYKSRQLVIQPDFQREVVWTKPAQTRFIDSLVKQLPIPSMCLSLDYKTEKRLMIDGLQRISSIIKFLTDDDWRLSNLDDIDPRIAGKTSGHIQDKHPEIYTRIENLTIPVTVLRCDYSRRTHMHYLFTIFHRLNTGGNKLTNQEIRNCIFQGQFNNLLKNIVERQQTVELFSLNPEKSYRFAYEERILRVFALSEWLDKYTGKLAKFLNEYMNSAKKLEDHDLVDKKRRMIDTIDLFYSRILDGQSLPRISKATSEAILVGIYRNIDTLQSQSDRTIRSKYKEVRTNELFSVDSLKEGLSAKDKVIPRIQKAIDIFAH